MRKVSSSASECGSGVGKSGRANWNIGERGWSPIRMCAWSAGGRIGETESIHHPTGVSLPLLIFDRGKGKQQEAGSE